MVADLARLRAPPERWAGFLLLVLLGEGQTWMVFRGLLIGRLPLAWSQAGMVALQRRRSAAERSCFENGWDADEEHLNPMACVACTTYSQVSRST